MKNAVCQMQFGLTIIQPFVFGCCVIVK